MSVPLTVPYSQLREQFPENSLLFIGRASFEERSLAAYRHISSGRTFSKLIFASSSETIEAGKLRFRSGLSDNDVIFLNTKDPLQAQMNISEAIKSVNMSDVERVIVDLTCFRREELLMLIRDLSRIDPKFRNRLTFLYSVAGEMDSWLSGSVSEIRSVIGYAGEIDSLKKTHLIIMAGIEHDRAVSIIEAYEPYSVSLGMVPEPYSITPVIYEKNLELRDYIASHFGSICTNFSFSATDPGDVYRKLELLFRQHGEFNIILAPLNTKISTFAAGVFAQNHPSIQLCYAQVDSYNSESYSKLGSEVLLFQYENFLNDLY